MKEFAEAASNTQPASSRYELNRDLAIWCTLHLLPFNFVESVSAHFFFHKNFSNLQFPCRQTLSVQGIDDVYEMVKKAVLKELKGNSVLCTMSDGWSDSHGYPYLGLRVGYITHQWDYSVVIVCTSVFVPCARRNRQCTIRLPRRARAIWPPA